MNILKKTADNSQAGSVSNKFRRKRFEFFLEFIKDIPRPVRILDVGGTANFWEQMLNPTPALPLLEDGGQAEGEGSIISIASKIYDELNITILNTEIPENLYEFIKFIKGDARDLSMFKDKEFDVVFSNSVIEHVGGYDEQKKMANEIMRTGKRYFVQTPNCRFPFEPHFLFPFFQFLPRSTQMVLLMNFNMGWYKKCASKDEALNILNSINLLTLKELKSLFKSGRIYKEKFLFLNKSFIVYQ